MPSSFFCCLYRLMLMRLTEKQVYTLIRPDMVYQDGKFIPGRNNPFVRAAGMLYIRYLSPPEQLWPRLYLFLLEVDDQTSFAFCSDKNRIVLMGDYVKMLLEDKQYVGQTVLPRIPTLANRDILAKLHSLEERRQLKI